jgi:hypothetical protein
VTRARKVTGLVAAVAFFTFATSCATEEPPAEAGECFGKERLSFTLKCLNHSLGPVTDPTSPDFGRVPCNAVMVAPVGSDFCACDWPGYAVPNAALRATAKAQFADGGACDNGCCDTYCYCELLQLSGNDLALCQAGDPDNSVDLPGFCYVEPDVGVGDPSTVRDCKADERFRLLFTPGQSRFLGTIVCASPP